MTPPETRPPMFFRTVCLCVIVWGVLVAPVFAQGESPAVREAAQALELWDPLSIEQQGSRLVITSRERRVNHTVYTAMIGAGICLYAGTGQIQLTGITEIVILNRFQGMGWVFEGGKSSCVSIAKASSGKRELLIAGQTHMYMDSIDGKITP